MKEEFKGFFGFIRGIFSEQDGTPSASRVIMFLLSLVSGYCVLHLVRAVVNMTTDKAGVFLSSLPWIIAALASFLIAPYGINQGKGMISDLLAALQNKK